ncbi:putative RNA polymerase ECF-subfamily sigma factor [Patulibacter medicamentivorans]|uniref:Putative RNA polymerase ECF-subfamily sigma factor n=1 Tax=Patulibacter medicamentivorans TaxID=1097667 RepID=H0EC29_9ACTN|nr:sigma-70 family RNA polymerase sigma factor [Patulibacter medicamentivorans]EHN08765.1 putative RNA polymerase ECF-subfamily sigma factor [Patulibacter medicamentivorans]
MTSTDRTRAIAFERLFAQHYAEVVAYGHRRASADVAEDVAEETFLVAWRELEDLPEDTLPWLLAVAGRTLVGYREAAERREALLDRLAVVPERHHDDRFRISTTLRSELQLLSPVELEALLLVAWEELSPARAAIAAGCSRAAFRVRLHRARRRVGEALEASWRRTGQVTGEHAVVPAPAPASDDPRTPR